MNRRAFGDIGNLVSVPGVQGGKAQPPINRPITRSFRDQLLANAQLKRKPINGDNKVPALVQRDSLLLQETQKLKGRFRRRI